MRKTLLPAALVLALMGSAAVIAQNAAPAGKPGKPDPAAVTGGTYTVDGNHTQVLFAYDHMGISNNLGVIASPTGTLTLDPKNPSAAKVSVTFELKNLHTGIAMFDEHLQKPEWLDTAKFPTATFVSTGVKVDGNTADISGNLTIKGVTKPVVLDAKFYGVGAVRGKENIGFAATTQIKRSDFGMAGAVPIVDDALELKISAAFAKQ